MTDMLIRDIQQNDISLTFSQESFSDMILSFLGQKEKIEYITTDRFLLRHNDIEQFYYLIEQKLAKEKNIRISHFSLVTIYNDKTTRETNGIESVSKFNETRDVMPVSVTLSWNILVSFPNSQSIENQRIDLSFLINHVEYSPSGKYNLYFMPKGYYKSDIILSIQHTNQSWGVEILNLLRDKITQVTNKERFLCVFAKKVLLNFSTLSTILIYSFFIILACIFFYKALSYDDSNYLERYRINEDKHQEIKKNNKIEEHEESLEIVNAFKNSSNENDKLLILAMVITKEDLSSFIEDNELKNRLFKLFNEKIEREKKLHDSHQSIDEDNIKKIDDNNRNNFKNKKVMIMFMVLDAAGAVLLLLFIIYYCRMIIRYYSQGSYILITRRAEKEYQQDIDDRSKTVFYSITLITISIICGVIASFVYTFLLS